MKKTLLALALAVTALGASAQTFSIAGATAPGILFKQSTFDATNDVDTTKATFLLNLGFDLSTAVFGTLNFTNTGDAVGTLSASFIGKESKTTNMFKMVGGSGTLSSAGSFGSTISADAAAGTHAVQDHFSNAWLPGGKTLYVLNSSATQALALYNDPLGFDRDFDDMVVRLQGTAGLANPVPEPETYALMLAGLAGLGFVAKRRKA